MTRPTLFDLDAPPRAEAPTPATSGGGAVAIAAAPRVLGLDLSLTALGAAGNWDGGWATTIKPPSKLVGHERLAYLCGGVIELLTGVDYCAVEGPAFGSKGSAYHQLAGQWWMTTHSIWARGIPCGVVPPNVRALYATGSGIAGKDVVIVAVARAFPWFQGDNNSADALVIASMATDHLGHPMWAVTDKQRAALAKAEWPTRASTS
jgi:Holliday junction resolvasome RuvABC endonuclease subunit